MLKFPGGGLPSLGLIADTGTEVLSSDRLYSSVKGFTRLDSFFAASIGWLPLKEGWNTLTGSWRFLRVMFGELWLKLSSIYWCYCCYAAYSDCLLKTWLLALPEPENWGAFSSETRQSWLVVPNRPGLPYLSAGWEGVGFLAVPPTF
jgi:hypothetical protein